MLILTSITREIIMNHILIVLGFALFLTGCSTKEDYVLFNKAAIGNEDVNKSVTKLNKQKKFEYKILPHDRVSITMYNHPELGTSTVQSQREDTRGILVNSNGYVRLPLIKSIHIAGLTQTAAQKKIEKAYSKFLEDAEVSLEVLNKRAFILGEIKSPGQIPLFNERLTLFQLLATAGGLTNEANRKSILVMRNINNKLYTKRVDLTGKHSLIHANMMVYPNDVIYVVPNDMKAFNTGINEISPAFSLVGTVLQPFVNIKFLSE